MTLEKALKTAASSLAIVAITALLLEAGLRLFPGAIPVSFLVDFSPAIRAEIAAKRGLPTRRDLRAVPRDDGGPELLLPKPNTEFDYGYRDEGAVNPQRTDEEGFCNEPHLGAADESFDIIAVGDSFTWCLAVEPGDAWPRQLGIMTGLTSRNLGIQGIGLYEHIQILKWVGLRAKPRYVVVNIYEGNDFRDALKYWAHRERAGQGTEPVGLSKAPDGKNAVLQWAERSYTYNTFRAAAFPKEHVTAAAHKQPALRGQKDQGPLTSLYRTLMSKAFFPDFRYDLIFGDAIVPFNTANGDLDEANFAAAMWQGKGDLRLFDRALEELARLGKDHGFLPIVVYTPTAYSAYKKHVRFSDPRLASLTEFFSDAQRYYFADRTEKLGLLFVDTTETMRASAAELGPDSLLHFPINRHLTPQGHELVAGAVAEAIKGREP